MPELVESTQTQCFSTCGQIDPDPLSCPSPAEGSIFLTNTADPGELGAEVMVCDMITTAAVTTTHTDVATVGSEVEISSENAEDIEANFLEWDPSVIRLEPVESLANPIEEIPTGHSSNLLCSPPRLELSRRVSYEEMVHEYEEDQETASEDAKNKCTKKNCDSVLSDSPSMEKCLIALTQWALTLQHVSEELQAEKPEYGPSNPSEVTRCLCAKADNVMQALKKVESNYYEVIETCDNAVVNPDLQDIQSRSVRDLTEHAKLVQGLLRSAVSIQISRPNDDIKNRSTYIVGEVCDVRQYVRDAIDTLVQLVYDMLNVRNCKRHQGSPPSPTEEYRNDSDFGQTFEEEDMCLGVASLRTNDDVTMDTDTDEVSDEKENWSSRKRKQLRNENKTVITSPTSSPSKRPRRSRSTSAPAINLDAQALALLESKRKVVRNNGLRQFVLWREALKAEKDRVGEEGSIINWRRLSTPH